MSLFKPFRGPRAALDAVEKHDGYAYFCLDDGTFHIDFTDADGNLQRKQIDGVKPDWNAQEGEDGHILNRTHWKEEVEVEILPESVAITPDSSLMGELYIAGNPIILEVGKTYKVIYNGIEYESVASEFILPQIGLSVGLGDVDVATTGVPSGAYPFALAVNDLLVQMGACAAVIPLDGSSNITVSILGKNEIIHHISPKYIKDMYYTDDDVEVVILPEITVPSNTDLPLEQPFAIKAGETYICIADGIEYECIAIEIGAALGVSFSVTLLGNTALLDGVNTGEPFYFVTSANEIQAGTYGMAHIDSDKETVTVSIKQVKENIHKLDNKYLDLDWLPKIKYAKGNSFYSNDSLSFSSTILDSGVEVGQQMIFDNDFSTITIDDILFISFDEEVYECKAFSYTLPEATVLGFGNQSIMGIGANTGEPFIIMFTESLGIVCTHSDKIGSTHSLELSTAIISNPIPTEFLPSDLTAIYDMGIDFNHYIGRPFADISAQMNDAYNAYLKGNAVFAKYQSSTGLVLSIFNDTIDDGLNSYVCLATEKGLFCFNGQNSIKVQSITYADLSNLGALANSAILYEAQTLTEEQKAQARANIGVGTGGSDFSGSYNDLTDKPTLGSLASKSIVTKNDLESAVQTSLSNADNAVPNTRTINKKVLNQDIVLTSTDVNGVAGIEYEIDGETVVAQYGAEVFNSTSDNKAIGSYSHAEGRYTTASGTSSHAEGSNTVAIGYGSHTEGFDTTATESYSHAEGCYTTASGHSSHAEGNNTTASGNSSHAEGFDTTATGNYSHAEGIGSKFEVQLTGDINTTTYTSNDISKAKIGGIVRYENIYAEVISIDTENNAITLNKTLSSETALSSAAAFIITGIASGHSSHTEGNRTTASGNYSHAEGSSTIVFGDYSHAEGSSTIASGDCSHTEGSGTTAFGKASHAEGIGTQATGECSHTEGYGAAATGYGSHAEGRNTTASGNVSHAEGNIAKATGSYSHAEGEFTTASGISSHAEGNDTIASGHSSHAEGDHTKASGDYSHVQGRFNIEDIENKYAHIVGNGGDPTTRSNAHTLDWDGNAWFAGNVECTGVIIKSSTAGSTKKFKLTIDDSGVITATEVI